MNLITVTNYFHKCNWLRTVYVIAHCETSEETKTHKFDLSQKLFSNTTSDFPQHLLHPVRCKKCLPRLTMTTLYLLLWVSPPTGDRIKASAQAFQGAERVFAHVKALPNDIHSCPLLSQNWTVLIWTGLVSCWRVESTRLAKRLQEWVEPDKQSRAVRFCRVLVNGLLYCSMYRITEAKVRVPSENRRTNYRQCRQSTNNVRENAVHVFTNMWQARPDI